MKQTDHVDTGGFTRFIPGTPRFLFKWMIQGYHHFRKPPYTYIYIYPHRHAAFFLKILHIEPEVCPNPE